MLSRFYEKTGTYFGASPANKKRLFAALAIIVAPIVLIAVISYFRLDAQLTEAVWVRRASLSTLSAAILKEKLDRLMDISRSLATRVRFRDLVSQGDWNGAVKILSGVPAELQYIERIFIADTEGTLQADTPAIPGMVGQNFATRDWYTGVSKEWKPYLSEVYTRQAEPRYNVLAVATPIVSAEGKPTGILVMQVRVDKLFEWTRAVDVGTHGFVYIVDKRGKIASHPKYDAAKELVDFSAVPVVTRVLRGESGAELTFNQIENEERVTAFTPVPEYGWGVIAQQRSLEAFAVRDRALMFTTAINAFVFVFTCGLAWLIVMTLQHANTLQQSLKDNVVHLEAANKELEAFSYSVSHDLRAPLRSIEGFSRILEEDYKDKLDDEGRDSLQRIRAATVRMSQLIDDLIGLSRVARTDVIKETVDMSSLARHVIKDLQRDYPWRKVEVVVANELAATGDPRLLRVLLVNLIGNAWKFTAKNEEARIEFGQAAGSNGSAPFFVKDNGAGFDMTYSNKLFAPFQRLHPAVEFAGTGIGLATVQRIVAKHGGKVWAEGKPEEGATFYFQL